MAAAEYAKPSCETDEELQDRLVEDGAAPEVRLKRTSPAWRVLTKVVGGVLLLAAVVGATVSSSLKTAAGPHRDSVVARGPRAQTRRPTGLNKVFALRHKAVSLQAVQRTLQGNGANHSMQDDVEGMETAAAGGVVPSEPPPFAAFDDDGDGSITFAELKKFLKANGLWADEDEEHVQGIFDWADADGDGGVDEDEYVAATEPGKGCLSHDRCDEFCYKGVCAPCDECRVCNDGIDGTCGTCGEGFPTTETGPCE